MTRFDQATFVGEKPASPLAAMAGILPIYFQKANGLDRIIPLFPKRLPNNSAHFLLGLPQPHTLQENSCLTTSNSESATMQRAKRSSSRHSNRSAYLLSRRGRRRLQCRALSIRGLGFIVPVQNRGEASAPSPGVHGRESPASRSFLSRGDGGGWQRQRCTWAVPGGLHANYYAAFVIGPDGHNIEVVCHEPEA